MTGNAPVSLLVIGECMLELAGEGEVYRRSFAGDTYNTAVYAKRRCPDLDVQMLTAIGTDPISADMINQWDTDGVGHQLALTSPDAHPGVYAISTDHSGERSFTYWRKDSAATQLVSLLSKDVRDRVQAHNCIYFSGITLAILNDRDKAELLELISTARAAGSMIVFDPNYRAVLWRNKEQARQWITKAYTATDLALPGLADHQLLFEHTDESAIQKALTDLQVNQIVIKADDDGVFGYARGGSPVHIPIEPHPHPVDTTGAGDSFAGTLLAEKLTGATLADAMRSACAVARIVIEHRGAVIPLAAYQQSLEPAR